MPVEFAQDNTFCEIPIFKHAAMAKDGTKIAFVPAYHAIFGHHLVFKNIFFTKNISLRKLYRQNYKL